MFHIKEEQSLRLHHWTLSKMIYYFLFLLLLPHCCEGVPEVIGSSQPLIAYVGDDVILPCQLKPAVDAAPHTIERTRPDLKPRFVHLLRSGELLLGDQNPSYVGRTSLFISELKNGNVSLKLSRVKVSDRGTYRCFIPTINIDTTVELLVGSVSSPSINISKSSDGVSLDCRAEGWFPEPELLWLDTEGRVLSAGPTETLRGPDGLFTVSSRMSVEKSNRDSFTCRVHQTNITQSREIHVQISAGFFETPSSVVYVVIIVVLVLSAVVAAALIFWKWRRNQTKEAKLKRDKAEEEELMKKDVENLVEEKRRLEGELQEKRRLEEELQEEKRRLEEEKQKEKRGLEEELQKSLGEKRRLEQDLQKSLEEKKSKLKEELKKTDSEVTFFKQMVHKMEEHSTDVQKLTDELKHLKEDTERRIEETENKFKSAERTTEYDPVQKYSEMKTTALTAKTHLQRGQQQQEKLYNETHRLQKTKEMLDMMKHRQRAAESNKTEISAKLDNIKRRLSEHGEKNQQTKINSPRPHTVSSSRFLR